MSEQSGPESEAEDLLVARFEIPGAGSAVNQADISAGLKGIRGVKAVVVANGAIEVTYNPLQTGEKQIEESIRRSGATPSGAEIGWELPHPDLP
jgi:copper chaperone CopZ